MYNACLSVVPRRRPCCRSNTPPASPLRSATPLHLVPSASSTQCVSWPGICRQALEPRPVRDDMRRCTGVHHQTLSRDTVSWLSLADQECVGVLIRLLGHPTRVVLPLSPPRRMVLLPWLYHCWPR
ncbi:hypothetical protein AAFF_G00097440 [Aldrovandia affinis]|uniref:Uncharacterized protein n=1 Tax=Aldrovandia affinis TaxID=143900 RepID=A0AAD7R171_9TELE|nr:hypothetical protein AAFF_G00097440 [Aldrovandia affinis]